MSSTEVFDLEEQQVLRRTQDVRERIVTELTERGIPSDKEDRTILLSTLKDMDNAVFNKARTRIASKAEQNNTDVLKMNAELLRNISGDAFRKQPSPEERALDPSHSRTFVPGELEIGVAPISADEIGS